MEEKKGFFGRLISPSNGVSSKRAITLIAFMLMASAFIGNLFFDLTIEEFIYESMAWIVIGGLGFTLGERFSKQIVNEYPEDDSYNNKRGKQQRKEPPERSQPKNRWE